MGRRPGNAENVRKLLYRLRLIQSQLLQPIPVDEKMAVCVDVLRDEKPQLIHMPVRGRQLIPKPAVFQPRRIIGHQSSLDVFIQRNQQMAGYSVFLHVQRAAENQIRQFSFRKGQADRTVPFRILHLVKIHVNAGLGFDLLVKPHVAEIHRNIFDFILQRSKGNGGRGRLLIRFPGRAAGQKQNCGEHNAKPISTTVHMFSFREFLR